MSLLIAPHTYVFHHMNATQTKINIEHLSIYTMKFICMKHNHIEMQNHNIIKNEIKELVQHNKKHE